MPNSEKIESLISKEALQQFEQLYKLVEQNVTGFEKLITKGVELNKQLSGAKSFKDVADGAKKIEEAEEELIHTQQDLLKSQELLKKSAINLGDSFANVGNKIQNITGQAEDAFAKLLKLNEALKANKKAQQDLAQQKSSLEQMNKDIPEVARSIAGLIEQEKALKAEEFALKKAVTDTNKEIKQRLNLNLTTPGSREEIKNTIASLKQLRDTKIDINTDEGRASIAEINKEIDRLNKVLEQTTDKLEKRKINIGNYPGAVKALEKGLDDVKKKIDDYTKSGQQNEDVLKSLTQEQGLLEQLLKNQSQGFATLAAAFKDGEKALLLLKEAGLEDEQVFKELFAAIAQGKDELAEFKKELQTRGSGELALEGAIQAAQTLAGIYGLAQGAAALFGDENEELQKTMVKLQAVVAILNGLEAINNALKKENALRTSLTVGLEKIQLVQTYLLTAAESKNIIVRYAAIAAQKALNFAMTAAGGPITVLLGLVALLALSFKAFAADANNVTRSMEVFADKIEANSKLLEDDVDATKNTTAKAIAEMEYRNASESAIRVRMFQGMQEELAKRKAFNDKNEGLFNAADQKIRFYISKGAARLDLRGNVIKAGKKLTDEELADLDYAIKVRDQYNENQEKQFDLERGIEITRLQFLKKTNDDIAKADQNDIETSKASLQTRLQLQQAIAANERKTQTERIAALSEAGKIQQELINSDAQSKLLTPGLTPTQINVIESQRKSALVQSRRDTNKAIEDLNRTYAERERKARFDIARTEVEDQVKANDLIVANEAKSFDQRTDALYNSYQGRRAIIIAQHEFDIKNDTLTAEERLAIEKKYLSDINNLTVEYGLQQIDIYKQNQEKVTEQIERNQQGRLDKIGTQGSKELTALDARLREGNISVEDYARERANIEQKYSIITLKQEVDNATAKVLATKEGTNERYAAEKELADKTLALSDAVTQKQIEAQQKLAEVRKELATTTFDTISSIQLSQFDKESAAIQKQIDAIDYQKQKEIDAANASVGTEQEKATAVAKIEAKAQLQREQLERKQRQIALERARFEKASNIAQIIASTATAVIEALKTYKGTPQAFAVAATIGSIGALNLAKAIAAPLPAFEHGTDDAPGGLALVSEKRPELVITPQGQLMQTPNVPTVMNIPRHSIVLPDARKALESGLAVNQFGRLVQQDNNNMIEQKLDHIAKVIKNKPVLNMSADQGGLTAMWKYGSNWIQYVEDQTRF